MFITQIINCPVQLFFLFMGIEKYYQIRMVAFGILYQLCLDANV